MTTDEIIAKVSDAAASCGLDQGIAVAQAQRESSFRQDVVFGPKTGPDGERGIMQFTDGTWRDWGEGDFSNAWDIDANLRAWCRYMSHLLDMFGGDYTKALQAYNGGPGGVQSGRVSQPAQNYANAIAAAMGGGGAVLAGGGGGNGGNGGNGAPDQSSIVPILLIGLLAVGLIWYMKE